MKHEKVGLILDKPNVHRLLELCVHTIPVFGHAKHVTELVLENAHQNFKTFFEMNPHCNAHLSGMDRTLRRDFLSRISRCKREEVTRRNHSGRRTTNLDVLSMILGKETNFLARHNGLNAEQMQNLENSVDALLQCPVSRFLSIAHVGAGTSGNGPKVSQWEGKGNEKSESWINLAQDGVEMLREEHLCRDARELGAQCLPKFIRNERARYVRRSCSGGRSNVDLHEIVRPEDVVQVILDTPLSAVLRPPSEQDSTK